MSLQLSLERLRKMVDDILHPRVRGASGWLENLVLDVLNDDWSFHGSTLTDLSDLSSERAIRDLKPIL